MYAIQRLITYVLNDPLVGSGVGLIIGCVIVGIFFIF